MRWVWSRLLSLVLAGTILAGCANPDADAMVAARARSEVDPIVVAILDSGTNPYLPIFQSPNFAPAFDHSFETVVLSMTGSIPDRIDADEEVWARLQPNQLYHFAGTRLLAIGFDADREFPQIRDANQHGSATTYLVARDAPEAVILSVQIDAEICVDPECGPDVGLADAMEWVAAQDWIDVVSISLGTPFNPPPAATAPHAERFIAATEAAARSGKLVVAGAGNHLAPPLMGQYQGPPWVIAVGGFEFDARGQAAMSSAAGVDVAANYTEWAPRYLDGELTWRSGTSFSAPVVAGTLAASLSHARALDATRRFTASEVRDALNASAALFGLADWRPGPPGKDPLPWDLASYHSIPVVLQQQMGWGYVNSSLAPEIARRVFAEDFHAPSAKAEARTFQPVWQSAREEFWMQYRATRPAASLPP